MDYVLIGSGMGDDLKAFGPFPDADAAREFCNDLGLPMIRWTVVPLQGGD